MEPIQRAIILDQHIIEAWGLWWIQWQKDQTTLLRRSLIRVERKEPGSSTSPAITICNTKANLTM